MACHSCVRVVPETTAMAAACSISPTRAGEGRPQDVPLLVINDRLVGADGVQAEVGRWRSVAGYRGPRVPVVRRRGLFSKRSLGYAASYKSIDLSIPAEDCHGPLSSAPACDPHASAGQDC